MTRRSEYSRPARLMAAVRGTIPPQPTAPLLAKYDYPTPWHYMMSLAGSRLLPALAGPRPDDSELQFEETDDESDEEWTHEQLENFKFQFAGFVSEMQRTHGLDDLLHHMLDLPAVLRRQPQILLEQLAMPQAEKQDPITFDMAVEDKREEEQDFGISSPTWRRT